MKYKSKDAASDIVILLVLLVIFGTTAVIVFGGIGDKTEAMSIKTTGIIEKANNVNTVPGDDSEVIPPAGGSEIPPAEGPETPPDETGEPEVPTPEVPDDDFFYIDEEILESMVIVQPLTAEERLYNNEILEAQIDKKLTQNTDNDKINFRSIKLTRHEAYMLQEYTNHYNGYDFNGMLAPTGNIRDVFVKYRIIS